MLPISGPASYSAIAVMAGTLIALAAVILFLTHALPKLKRTGPIKDAAYECGVDPIGDARRKFNIPFYLVVMLFLLFDVELVFMYPWAVVMHSVVAPVSAMSNSLPAGYSATFLLGEMGLFMGVLLIGFAYAWRKRIFLD